MLRRHSHSNGLGLAPATVKAVLNSSTVFEYKSVPVSKHVVFKFQKSKATFLSVSWSGTQHATTNNNYCLPVCGSHGRVKSQEFYVGVLLPFDNKADSVPLLQDALEFGHPVGTGSFEGNLVRYANYLHCLRITGNLPVRHRNHVIQTQRLG